MEKLQNQTQTQTQPQDTPQIFPPNVLLTNIEVLPDYEGYPRPHHLQDIHTTLSLISNTVWIEYQFLDYEKFSVLKQSFKHPKDFAKTLYQLYLWIFLHEQNPNITISEYRKTLKKHPFEYYDTSFHYWFLFEEIKTATTFQYYDHQYRTRSSQELSSPTQTIIMIMLIKRLLAYYREKGNITMDYYPYEVLFEFVQKIEWLFGSLWISEYTERLNKTQQK